MTLVDHDHIGWKSCKLIAWTISATSSLFIAKRSSTYSQGNMEKFWGENVHSTPTSIMSGWIESTESYVILGGGVAFCLLLSAHRTVIFAIALFSCYSYCWSCVWQFFIKWRWFMFVWLITDPDFNCDRRHYAIRLWIVNKVFDCVMWKTRRVLLSPWRGYSSCVCEFVCLPVGAWCICICPYSKRKQLELSTPKSLEMA